MAGEGAAQQQLDRIVGIVAADMVAEVCSVYVRRAGDVLELFATHGLKAEAVHNTRLRIGEGIVGDVAARARPFALSDAQAHPNFAYRPETGEDIFQSMMGVPILRGGRVIGVIAIQNRTQRHYDEEEVETLQTVAMVLAEMVAAGELIQQRELAEADGIALKPLRLEGIRLNAGLAVGRARLHRARVRIERFVADDPELEGQRLKEAIAEMTGALDDMFDEDRLKQGGEHHEVLETYRMIAEDAGWLNRMAEAIGSGLTAEGAVQRVQEDIRARYAQVTDPYLRERVHDFDDLADRLLRHLVGESGNGKVEHGPDLAPGSILVARSMGPAQLLDYEDGKLAGVVLEEGSPNSHVAIIARALGLPVVGRIRNLLDRVEEGDDIVIDADRAQVFIRPGDDVRQSFEESITLRAEQAARYAELRDLPAKTRDGTRIELNLNAGLMVDMGQLEPTGAAGVGLYRTEVPFMVRTSFPDVAEQERLYTRVFEEAGGRPVVWRALDVGGDKVLPYWNPAEEENPAMGWRAIRISLDRPAILRQQCRALLRAAAATDAELHLMFPMVAEVAEFERARGLLEREIARERKGGRQVPEVVRCGAMLEVPGLAFQLEALLRRADFLSVGSNDLVQFLFAADRGNPRIAERYDVLSPAVLGVLAEVVRKADAAGKPVGLCGEMAGRPLEALALIGLGYRRLSMSAPGVGPVKAMIRSLDLPPLERFVHGLLKDSSHSLRENLRGFAQDHGIEV
jgi:phosphotransferase system, enzyme I, PtsP